MINADTLSNQAFLSEPKISASRFWPHCDLIVTFEYFHFFISSVVLNRLIKRLCEFVQKIQKFLDFVGFVFYMDTQTKSI